MSVVHRARVVRTGLALGGLVAATFAATGAATPAHSSSATHGWASCLQGSHQRQAVFTRAARVSGVPRDILKGVSYMESRWDNHGGAPSTSGGYGPMHLTHVAGTSGKRSVTGFDPLGKGDGSRTPTPPASALAASHDPLGRAQLRTLDRAHGLTGISKSRLRTDAVANICGGAALLAHFQRQAGGARRFGDWSAAVARYSGATDRPTAVRFVRQVFTTIRHGEARRTNDGQWVRLGSRPGAHAWLAALKPLHLTSATRSPNVDCPSFLGCEWIPAPYEQYGSSPGAYGNHDLANRPHTMNIHYIVIHDTEGSYDTAMNLVQDPTYLAWNYTVRSVDGHIAQHLHANDVGWHAGNWYVNMHSIGVEHEGFAAQGASWYTEALYQDSAALVKHLAREFNVPIDRAHIIGHDQVPGITPPNVAGMHWDPGPYWDWQHYFDLLGHPIKGHRGGNVVGKVVTVAPGFADNQQSVTGCDAVGSGVPCPAQGTNFLYLHQSPSADSPLVTDVGLHPDGSPSTTDVADIGARAAAGQKFLVAARSGDWLGVWFLGSIAWLDSPPSQPTVLRSTGKVVVANGDAAVPVYGRAYPEQAAYPADIPYQTVVPLQYSIQPGQAYVLADRNITTDYYRAVTFNCQGTDDCTDVKGVDTYYEIWFGHRMFFVRAADVRIVSAQQADRLAAG